MEKAKELLNPSDEAIPVQICRDLASARLELEKNFSAVSQLCAEKRRRLMQAMETGRVSDPLCRRSTRGARVERLYVLIFRSNWTQHTRSILLSFMT